MKVYENTYLLISFFEKENLLEMEWLPKTKNMSIEEYKENSMLFLRFCKQFRPKYLISDLRNLFFPISPEVQDWVHENIFSELLAGYLHKLAALMSTEFITQLSIEQMIDENNLAQQFTTFFDDKEKARKWLLEQ